MRTVFIFKFQDSTQYSESNSSDSSKIVSYQY